MLCRTHRINFPFILFIYLTGGGESHSAEDEGIERDSGEGEYPDALHLDHHSREDGQTAGGTAVSTTTSTPSLIVAAAAAAPGTAVTSLAYVMDVSRLFFLSISSSKQERMTLQDFSQNFYLFISRIG